MIRTRARRAGPLAPDDRRRAIIDAVTPLLVVRGAAVTTRQMAEACGIAEGTIFRVFPDKVALVHEAVRRSLDPQPLVDRLAQIDDDGTLKAQVTEAALIVLEHFENAVALVMVLRNLPEGPKAASGPPTFITQANDALHRSLTDFFVRHADQLAVEPSRAAAALRGLVFASAHPHISPETRLSTDELVTVLLHGIAADEVAV